MNPNGTLSALLLGTFTIAVVHALIPSHWLALALVGRSQRWTEQRTMTVAAMAGSGHILMTLVFGWSVAAAGKELHRAIPPRMEHAATAGLLLVLGGWFIWPALLGKSGPRVHRHHESGTHARTAGRTSRRIGGASTLMGALVLGMTLSPCLDLLSVFLAASAFSWPVLLVMSAIMAVTTLSTMLLLVWLTQRGLQRLNLTWLERHEGLAIGGILIALGISLLLL